MELSTMLNMYLVKNGVAGGYVEAVRRTRKIGFTNMDLPLDWMAKGQSELAGDDWKKQAEAIVNEGAKLGVRFPQAHLCFAKGPFDRIRADEPLCEEDPWFKECLDRGIEICAMAGVKWAVVHPLSTLSPVGFDVDDDIAYNVAYYTPFFEKAGKLGVGIAIENMCDTSKGRRFGVTAWELIALMKAFRSDNVRLCWDFGHGKRTYKELDQVPSVRKVGPYLRATHVDDNYGADDLHMPPYQGKVEWTSIMRALKEVGYDDMFDMETRFTQLMPEDAKDLSCRLVYELGMHMLSLVE